MEIERKFWLQSLPPLEPTHHYRVRQGYISIEPVVRIRSKELLDGEPAGQTSFKMTVKGKGHLVREEIESEISAEFFSKLADFIKEPLIEKDFFVYEYDGHTLEVSIVDPGTDDEFIYGEVEFGSVEEASAYAWPFEGATDVTQAVAFKMDNYWKRTRLDR